MSKTTTYKNVAGFCCLRNIQKQTNDLYLVHCGRQQCTADYTYNHKIPNEYHLHFILEGKGILEINEKSYHLEKDDIFLIPKNTPIHYFADSEHPWEYIWVTFDGTVASNYLSYATLSSDHPTIHSAIPTKVYLPIIQKILDTNELTFANEIKRVGYLFELLGTLIDAQSSTKGSHHQLDYSNETYIDYALQYIKHNYDHIKVNDIAKYIGINRSYLSSIFKKKLNISPQEYLVTYKLKKATELLKSTNLSIQDISFSIGYENPLTFSKIFKQYYGVSPKSFRKQNLL